MDTAKSFNQSKIRGRHTLENFSMLATTMSIKVGGPFTTRTPSSPTKLEHKRTNQ